MSDTVKDVATYAALIEAAKARVIEALADLEEYSRKLAEAAENSRHELERK